jgi:hypothetical protein
VGQLLGLPSLDSMPGILRPNPEHPTECLHFSSFRPQYLGWKYCKEQQPGVGSFFSSPYEQAFLSAVFAQTPCSRRATFVFVRQHHIRLGAEYAA